jgi:hypothetical protein
MARYLFVCLGVLVAFMNAQMPKPPDLEAQKAAMKKLDFLAGKWIGNATIFSADGRQTLLEWSEAAHYRLDNLVLMVEAKGTSANDNKAMRQALGFISYEDATGTYTMRTFNDGRYLETELKLLEDGKGFQWGFEVGEVRTSSVLRINEKGQWTELHQIAVGPQPLRKFMEVTLSPEK